MAEANVSRQLLVEAIAALEAQGDDTGNDEELADAIQTALDVLRHRLAFTQSAGIPDSESLAILVADLSGFTALAERQDAERVQEAISAMWDVLDAVVTSWGGEVELHAGDSLVGLFGHPTPRRGDVERALYAALTMRTELELFNARARSANRPAGDVNWAAGWPGPAMRIGVHAGPLVIARQPAGRRRVLLGESWRVAQLLQECAEPGEVVASAVVWDAAHTAFEMQPHQGKTTEMPVYRVIAPRPPDPASPVSRPDDLPALAGRRDELEFLEQRFQLVADGHMLHTALMLADAGSGKSRLIHELERQLRVIHGPITVLRARATTQDAPFALVRELLAHRLDLRPQYSRYMKAHLITHALERLAGRTRQAQPPARVAGQETERMAGAADLLSRLLTPRDGRVPDMAEVVAANEIVLGIVAGDSPTLLVLEDIHLADRPSLELVEVLRKTTAELPLLILATADPAVEERDDLRDLSWLAEPVGPFDNHARLFLPPLSPVDSRLLAISMLPELTPAPLRLVDLLVAEARGNPLHIEQLIELFIAAGVIRTGERWAVDMDRAERMRLPRALPELIQQRVARLPELERQILEAGAVIGDTFWDESVERVLPVPVDLSALDDHLGRLVGGGLLAPEVTADLGGARAYRFQRRVVAGAIYDSLPPVLRSRYHRRAAAWLRALPPALAQRSWMPVSELAALHEQRARTGQTPDEILAALTMEPVAPDDDQAGLA